MTSERHSARRLGYARSARHPLQRPVALPDEVVVALVSAACVLGLNAAFTSLMHLTLPFLVSTAIPAYPFIAYLLTRPITRRGEQDALVWSMMIVLLSFLTLFYYAD